MYLSYISCAIHYLPERLPPTSIHSRESLVPHKPVPKSEQERVERRTRVRWTQKEEAYLRKGVERFGRGKWKEILCAYPFKDCRTNRDLKDKWRNICGEYKTR